MLSFSSPCVTMYDCFREAELASECLECRGKPTFAFVSLETDLGR